MVSALWFLAGAATATLVMAIVNVIFVLKDGTLHITKTEDKETYLFEISNLDEPNRFHVNITLFLLIVLIFSS